MMLQTRKEQKLTNCGKMHKIVILLCVLSLLVAYGAGRESHAESEPSVLVYEDALGSKIEFSQQELDAIASESTKVAVLNGSLAEIWSLAGGKLTAVTEDAYGGEREIAIDDATMNVGSIRNPNVEILLAQGVEIAILSADTDSQITFRDKLEGMGIKTIYLSVETFEDYLSVLGFFTELTGHSDNFETYGVSIAEAIEAQMARQDGSHPTVLFLRAYSTGVKAKGSGSMTGIMLKDLGCVNIADGNQRLTDDLSIEVILEKDPDYIFVTVMGSDEESGLESVKYLLEDNPAWSSLTAIQEGHYYVLPANMFHNKPNQRWGESYQMLADILYPEQEQS